MLIRDHIARAAACYADRIAVICGDEQRTFRDIDERSSRLANALTGLGLRSGDRVVLLSENSPRCIEVDFACAKAGLIRVSLNPRTTRRDAEFILRDASPKALIFGSSFDGLVSEIAPQADFVDHFVRIDTTPNSPALTAQDYDDLLAKASSVPPHVPLDEESIHSLLYTSGSSGRPKGVMLSNRSFVQTSYNVLIELGPTTPGKKIMLLQPLSHGAAFYILPYFISGGTSVLLPRFETGRAIRAMRNIGVHAIKLVPTMLQTLMEYPETTPDAFPELEHVIYGGSGIAGDVLRQAIEMFGQRLVQHYGQSEAPSTLTILPGCEHRIENITSGRLASAGRPWTTVDIRIIDSAGNTLKTGELGEVAVRAPQIMSGYWQNDDLTKKTLREGWLHTSDLGRFDDSGFLHLAGRKDEMIISGGFNIAPRDVEDVLHQHPSVREAAVIGRPDPRWGSAVIAFVSLRSAAAAADILAFTKPLLGYKNPKRLIVLDELPKNSNGKIQRSMLNAEPAGEQAS